MNLEHRDHLGLYLNEVGLTGIGAEIGVYYGAFSDQLLAEWKGQKLFGIDPYVNYSQEEYRDGCNLVDLEDACQFAQRRLKLYGNRFELIRKTSAEGVKDVPDGLDFAYIDGNHRYEHVSYDLVIWWDKIKPGGLMGGHDWYMRRDHHQICEVPKAVEEFAAKRGLEFKVTPCSSWWIAKPKD